MRLIAVFIFLFFSLKLKSQTDSVAGGVYSWNRAVAKKQHNGEIKTILKGSSKDLSSFEIHASTLQPGKSADGPDVVPDREKLIIVKEGSLTISVNGTTRTLGAAGFAVILAGDPHGFKNATAKPVTYYSLNFTARSPVNIQRGKQAGGSFMKDWNELVVKQTDKGESRPIFDRPSSMFPRFDMHATALNPGFDSHDPHTHRAEEILLMIKGDVRVQLGENFLKAATGDIIFYPAYSLHAVKNTGNAQCGYFAIQWHNE